MKAQLGQFLFFAVVLFASVYGQVEDTPQIYCGRRLAQMMAVVCQNYEKRSDFNSIRHGYEPEFGWPWFSRNLERPHLQDRGLARDLGVRGKRGIIEDCCDQSCSVATLLTYC